MKKKQQLIIDHRNPFIAGHCVHGQHLLPGLAYIDLIYQAVHSNGLSVLDYSLQNLTIYQPLVLAEQRKIVLIFNWQNINESSWRITVNGAGQQQTSTPYITVDVHPSMGQTFNDNIHIQVIRESSTKILNISDVYADYHKRGLIHNRFMQMEGNIYVHNDVLYINGRCSAAAVASAVNLLFNPILLDGSAVAASGAFPSSNNENEQRLYLPLFFESFVATELLQQQCWVRVEKNTELTSNDLYTETLEFFNGDGYKIAEVKNLTTKLVREAELIETDDDALSSVSAGSVISLDINSPAQENKPDQGSEENPKSWAGFLLSVFAQYQQCEIYELDAEQSFYELGLNSVDMLTIIDNIGKHIHQTLLPTLLFEYTSIQALATYLQQQYGELPENLSLYGQRKSIPSPIEQGNINGLPPLGQQSSINQRKADSTIAGKNNTELSSDIAIVGIHGRYPLANNLTEFWQNLVAAKDCITEIPSERWEQEDYYDRDKELTDKSYCKWGGFIADVDKFDALFFNISTIEAQTMDPQQRLFLETVWALLEISGYTRASLKKFYNNRVGVYVGAMYQHYRSASHQTELDAAIAISSYSAIANRTSYYFGLQGPSIAIDTMCSSSAMAIHIARKDLLQNECEMAIVGGVNLSIHPHKYIGLSQVQLLASDSDSRSFAQGDGYLPAEGVGAALLKTLQKAQASKDSILAVIKSTATNHSGRANAYMVPDPSAQADVMQHCLQLANLNPDSISYIESAANGSALGDPIEIAALAKVFANKTNRQKKNYIIGTVKSNIGHPEAVSGLAQLSKVVLQCLHRQLLPTVKLRALNPNLHLQQTPFVLQEQLEDWNSEEVNDQGETIDTPRRALINSFAAGGSYVSMVIEEYQQTDFSTKEAEGLTEPLLPQLLILSAKDENRLRVMAEQFVAFITRHEDMDLTELAYTLQLGREEMPVRLAFIMEDYVTLLAGLKAYLGLPDDKHKNQTLWTGDAEETQAKLNGLLTGRIGDDFVKALLQENNLQRIANYWIQGGVIPWADLWHNKKVKFIALPTYPFYRQRIWVDDNRSIDLDSSVGLSPEEINPEHNGSDPTQQITAEAIARHIIYFLSEKLGVAPDLIKSYRAMHEYGLDSVLGLRLAKYMTTKFSISISGRDLLANETVDALAKHIEEKISNQEQSLLPTTYEQSVALQSTGGQSTDALETMNANIIDEAVVTALKDYKRGLLHIDNVEALLDEEFLL